MYSRANNIEYCTNFNNDIVSVIEWFNKSWQLKINFDKCEVLHLGHNNKQYPYAINENNIPEKEFCRDLGAGPSFQVLPGGGSCPPLPGTS